MKEFIKFLSSFLSQIFSKGVAAKKEEPFEVIDYINTLPWHKTRT